MDKIIHHDEFKSLHVWQLVRIHGLVSLQINNQRVKVKVLDMHWHEVSSDVNQAYNVKTSNLFNKIGNKELNTLGGQSVWLHFVYPPCVS